MSARLVAAAIAGAITLIALSPPASAQTPADRVAVRVYDFAALDVAVRTRAAAEARAIVADAGVMADWHNCEKKSACTPAADELVVRIVREPGAHGFTWPRALGYAVIDPVAAAGTLATIFINRVEDTSRQAGLELSLLLGRAIAHEIGHLILRTNAHGQAGLMRPFWTEQELSRNQPEDWTFAPPDRRQIRAALQQMGKVASN